MSRELEIESKVLLNSDDFYTIFEFLELEESSKVEQINYYFDTESKSLIKKDISMRVRQDLTNNSYTLTVKIPQAVGKLEINEQISLDQFAKLQATGILPQGDIALIIGELEEKLILLTSLTTIRYEINYEGGKLALDHNIYNNLQDFELEFEGTSDKHCRYVITKLMNQADINFDFNTVSKRARALNSIKKKKHKK